MTSIKLKPFIILLVASFFAPGDILSSFEGKWEGPEDPLKVRVAYGKNPIILLQDLLYAECPVVEGDEVYLPAWEEQKDPALQGSVGKNLVAFANLIGLSIPGVILSLYLKMSPFPSSRSVDPSISSNTCSIIRKIPTPSSKTAV